MNARPSWDEYFMGIMEAVATRATCERARSGAVIVLDKRIISTGYVGAPRGLPHCDEVGHLFKKAIISAGIKRVVCQMRYKDSELTRDFFKQAGIELVVLDDSVAQY